MTKDEQGHDPEKAARPSDEGSIDVDAGKDRNDDQKFPTQASGGTGEGKPDGVSGSPGGDLDMNTHGRSAGGESGGGAYPNAYAGKTPTHGRFMGHGGQTEIGYHGGGQAGKDGPAAPNSTTRGDDD